VVSNAEIFGTVTIKAPNVTIKNSRIRAQKPASKGIVNSTSTGVVIKDSEIFSDDLNPDTNGIMGHGFTLDGVEIHQVIDQVHIFGPGNVTIKNSWLHDNFHFVNDPNWNNGPSHDDNIQVVSGSNIRIEDSVIEDAKNAAIMLAQDAGAIASVKISGNEIGGGACSINIAPKERGPFVGLSIINNSFQSGTQRLANCAVITPAAQAPKVSLSGNIWDATKDPVGFTRG